MAHFLISSNTFVLKSENVFQFLVLAFDQLFDLGSPIVYVPTCDIDAMILTKRFCHNTAVFHHFSICYVHVSKVGHIPIRFLARQKFHIKMQFFGLQLLR